MSSALFRTKDIGRILKEADEPEHRLKRALTGADLVALGIGAIIGAGIFATVGTAVAGGANHAGAGPGLILSMILVAVACSFCALCYAEFASLIPIAGSAYTYAYATMGELIAWIIGWDLIIEYAVGNVAVAISWSGYLQQLLAQFGLKIPSWLGLDLRSAHQAYDQVSKLLADGQVLTSLSLELQRGYAAFTQCPHLFGYPVILNLPALLGVAVITGLLVYGIKESSRFNSVMVILKVLILLFFILVGAYFIKPENWTPFMPNGWKGVQTGAALIFFAYIGFDAVSTAAEETKNPARNLPIGMIGSLIICTILYIAVAAVLTGMVHYTHLGTAEPLATAFAEKGIGWATGIVSIGAVIATTAVLLVFTMGQPRIFFSMARDGLLPKSFSKVHKKFRTPYVTTILTGGVVAIFASFANINEVVELCNIGTLFAFVLVCAGIIVLRYKDPDRKRPFKVPFVPWIPILGIISCAYLMLGLPAITWARFGVWLIIGLVIYFCYGYKRSKLRAQLENEKEQAPSGVSEPEADKD